MVYNINKGVREEMVKKYGLDDKKIGWDGKNVTYDGKHFLTPTSVKAGRSYAPESSIQRAVSQYFGNGDYGVRSSLDERGVDTSKLGYNNGVVTYNGKELLKPDRVENGVSYVSDPNDIANATINAYKLDGKNIVKATDYVAGKQLPFDVNYANDLVWVNGQSIKPVYVDNGYAYVDAAEMDKVIGNAQTAMGIKDTSVLLDEYMTKNDRLTRRYENLVNNRKPFEYDYNDDPAYQAYKDMYTREGDRAMRDLMGEYSARTGGQMNSAAVTAGAQANNYYMQQLGDKIPELYQAAYNRYNADYLTKLQDLEKLIGLNDESFEKEYGVNSDIINTVYKNNLLKQQRDEAVNNKLETDKANAIIEVENAKKAEAEDIAKIITSGQIYGAYTPEQNAKLAKWYGLPEGTVLDPFGAERNAAKVENELASLYATPKTTSYSDGGGGGGNKKIKNAVGYINEFFNRENDLKEDSYKYRLIKNSDVLRFVDGKVYWNVPEKERHAFDDGIMKELLNNDAISREEMIEICNMLDINPNDKKYNYLLK